MGMLSLEHQETIEQRLQVQHHCIFLLCDDYLVSAMFSQVSQNKLGIVVDVNGWFKGKWFLEPYSDECKRFYRPVTRSRFKPSLVKKIEKSLGKRHCKKEGYYDKCIDFASYWLRPKPFIRHILKNNQSVKVLSSKEYEAAIAQLKKETSNEPQ